MKRLREREPDGLIPEDQAGDRLNIPLIKRLDGAARTISTVAVCAALGITGTAVKDTRPAKAPNALAAELTPQTPAGPGGQLEDAGSPLKMDVTLGAAGVASAPVYSAPDFKVFNATRQPADIAFLDYAIGSAEAWVQKAASTEGGVNIGGYALALIQPRDGSHSMTLVTSVTEATGGQSRSDGVTFWVPGRYTNSFVGESGSPERPFRHKTIATEVCQSLLTVSGVETLPGGAEEQAALQSYVGRVINPAAAENTGLAMQEHLCNTLGHQIAAAYENQV